MFIVMEYIDGLELKEKLKSGPLGLDEAKNIAVQVAMGLQAAHEKNIDQRFHSIDYVVSLLIHTKQDSIKTTFKTQYIIYGILIIFIIALLLWNQLNTTQQSLERPETKVTKITFDPGLEDEPTFSPDGKLLAYTTDDKENFDIIVKPLDGGKTIPIVDHEADDAQAS